MTPVVIALGSNLGDRIANLRAAVELMEAGGVSVKRCSSVWETDPVPSDQPAYLNAVIAGDTALAPEPLLAVLKQIEHALGRRPERRWGPRPIDLDILFHGATRFETAALTIPHPRIAERPFVLAPLSEVLRGPLPVLGLTAAAMLANLAPAGLRRTGLALCPESRSDGSATRH